MSYDVLNCKAIIEPPALAPATYEVCWKSVQHDDEYIDDKTTNEQEQKGQNNEQLNTRIDAAIARFAGFETKATTQPRIKRHCIIKIKLLWSLHRI